MGCVAGAEGRDGPLVALRKGNGRGHGGMELGQGRAVTRRVGPAVDMSQNKDGHLTPGSQTFVEGGHVPTSIMGKASR